MYVGPIRPSVTGPLDTSPSIVTNGTDSISFLPQFHLIPKKRYISLSIKGQRHCTCLAFCHLMMFTSVRFDFLRSWYTRPDRFVQYLYLKNDLEIYSCHGAPKEIQTMDLLEGVELKQTEHFNLNDDNPMNLNMKRRHSKSKTDHRLALRVHSI